MSGVDIRVATDADWPQIWPFFAATMAAGTPSPASRLPAATQSVPRAEAWMPSVFAPLQAAPRPERSSSASCR